MRTINFDFFPNRSEWGYTKVNNNIFRDNDTTLEERGMYMLLSQLKEYISKDQKRWELSGVGLSKIVKDGDRKIRAVYNSLARKGYLAIKQYRIRGRFYGPNEWNVNVPETDGKMGYTIIDNSTFREQLSLKELGMIGTLASLPRQFPTTVRSLASILKESPGTIQKYRKRVEILGYYVREEQENINGVFGSVGWEVRPISFAQMERIRRKREAAVRDFKKNHYAAMKKVLLKKLHIEKCCPKRSKRNICKKMKKMSICIKKIWNAVAEKMYFGSSLEYSNSS